MRIFLFTNKIDTNDDIWWILTKNCSVQYISICKEEKYHHKNIKHQEDLLARLDFQYVYIVKPVLSVLNKIWKVVKVGKVGREGR